MQDNLFILNKKIKNLKREYRKWEKDNEVDELYLKENLFDILSWIEICKNYINEDAKNSDVISGFLYVNNRKKHDTGIYKITKNFTNIYPSTNLFPSNKTYLQKFDVIWDVKEISHGRLLAYQNELKNKDIIETLDIVFEQINQNYIISSDIS